MLTQVIRQLVQPKLVGDTMGLNPLLTLFLLYLGFKIRGLAGMILAVPIGLFIASLYRFGAFKGMTDSAKELAEEISRFRENNLYQEKIVKLENNLDTDRIRAGMEACISFHAGSICQCFIQYRRPYVHRKHTGNRRAGSGSRRRLRPSGDPDHFLCQLGWYWAPIMSIRLGQKNEKAAQNVVANCFVLLAVMAAVLMTVMYLFKNQLLTVFGAGSAIFPYADEYLTWYLSGTAFALLSTGMNQFIICQGFAKVGMMTVLLGAVSNIILDPVLSLCWIWE